MPLATLGNQNLHDSVLSTILRFRSISAGIKPRNPIDVMKIQNCPCGVPPAMNKQEYGKMNRRVIVVKTKFLRGGGRVKFIDQIKYN